MRLKCYQSKYFNKAENKKMLKDSLKDSKELTNLIRLRP